MLSSSQSKTQEYVQSCTLPYKKNTDLLQQVQYRSTKVTEKLEHLLNEERLFSLESTQENFISVYEHYMEGKEKEGARLSSAQ